MEKWKIASLSNFIKYHFHTFVSYSKLERFVFHALQTTSSLPSNFSVKKELLLSQWFKVQSVLY